MPVVLYHASFYYFAALLPFVPLGTSSSWSNPVCSPRKDAKGPTWMAGPMRRAHTHIYIHTHTPQTIRNQGGHETNQREQNMQRRPDSSRDGTSRKSSVKLFGVVSAQWGANLQATLKFRGFSWISRFWRSIRVGASIKRALPILPTPFYRPEPCKGPCGARRLFRFACCTSCATRMPRQYNRMLHISTNLPQSGL